MRARCISLNRRLTHGGLPNSAFQTLCATFTLDLQKTNQMSTPSATQATMPPASAMMRPMLRAGGGGAGGSLGYADPDLGIGYGYVMTQIASGLLGDLRTTRLTEAVVACVS